MIPGTLTAIASRIVAAFDSGPSALPVATQLKRAEVELRERYGSVARAVPPPDRIRDAIHRLRRNGVAGLQARDHRVLSFSLAESVDVLDGDCLLERKAITEPLLSEWRAHAAERRLRASRWRGLLHSYLQFRGSRDPAKSAWEGLRSLLRFAEPYRDGTQAAPEWMEGFRRHAELAGDQPCRSYVKGLLDGDWQRVQALRTDLEVPEHSWVWTELTDAFIKRAVHGRDAEFRSHLPTALKIIGLAKSHLDGALALLLDRYAGCAVAERHDELLQTALEHWGSPQLARQSKWSLVPPKTKKLVAGWLALEDLRDFFELCQGTSYADTERLEFWLEYIHLASYTRILLGPAMRNSFDPDIRAFRERKGNRCGDLTAGQGFANNAFLMVLKDTLVVEFSEKGNAAYFYATTNVPFELDKDALSVTRLKNRSVGDALAHQPTNGRWMAKFRDELAARDLHPETSTGTSGATPAPSASRLDAALAWGKASSVDLPDEILKFLGKRGLSVVDLRGRGGAVWIHTGVRLWEIHEQLTKLGWSFRDERGYWTQ